MATRRSIERIKSTARRVATGIGLAGLLLGCGGAPRQHEQKHEEHGLLLSACVKPFTNYGPTENMTQYKGAAEYKAALGIYD